MGARGRLRQGERCYSDGTEEEFTVEPKNKPEIKKPENFDAKAAEELVKKVIRENKQWLKEMADK
jgi:hypothetical protein